MLLISLNCLVSKVLHYRFHDYIFKSQGYIYIMSTYSKTVKFSEKIWYINDGRAFLKTLIDWALNCDKYVSVIVIVADFWTYQFFSYRSQDYQRVVSAVVSANIRENPWLAPSKSSLNSCVVLAYRPNSYAAGFSLHCSKIYLVNFYHGYTIQGVMIQFCIKGTFNALLHVENYSSFITYLSINTELRIGLNPRWKSPPLIYNSVVLSMSSRHNGKLFANFSYRMHENLGISFTY